MLPLRVIGDVHGHIAKYINIVQDAERDMIDTLQIGDLGFRNSFLGVERFRESARLHQHHYLIKGNHDLYDNKLPWHLDDYGCIPNRPDSFYLRGGFSIDWRQRVEGLDYFKHEEVSVEMGREAIEMYSKVKPEYMFSHECPRSIVNKFNNPGILKMFGYNPDTFTTRTSEILEEMFKIHKPKAWYFGHYHKNWSQNVNGCQFRCIAELATCDTNAIS